MYNNLLSTKFLFAMTVTIMGFVLVLMGRVEVKPFFDFAIIVGGSYIVGNVASNAVDKIPSNKTNEQ